MSRLELKTLKLLGSTGYREAREILDTAVSGESRKPSISCVRSNEKSAFNPLPSRSSLRPLHVCQFQIVSTEGFTPPNCAQNYFGFATITIIDIQCLLPPLEFQ